MKNIIGFIKTTVAGGIIFLVPLFLVLFIMTRTVGILKKLIGPWVVKLGISGIAGKATLTIIVILLLVLICFISGMIARSGLIHSRFPILDSMAARIIPGYQILKAQSSEKGAMNVRDPWQAVYVKLEESWRIGFIVEQNPGGYNTVFLPDSPKMDSGEVHILEVQSMKFLTLPADQAYKHLKDFGSGAGASLGKLKLDEKEKGGNAPEQVTPQAPF